MAAQRNLRYCDTCGTRLAKDNRLNQCTTCQRKTGDLSLGPPPALAADFWTSGVIAQALHSWHIVQVIRAYRHHPFHGLRPLSQELVAGWLGLSQTQLSRIESGLPVKDLGKLIAWARALSIPTDLLWFKVPQQPGELLIEKRDVVALGHRPQKAPIDEQPSVDTAIVRMTTSACFSS